MLLAFMFGLAAVSWGSLPDRLPVHFDLSGHVDGWGTKPAALLVLPLVALALYGVFRVLPRLDPGRANYEGFEHAYLVIRTAVIALLAALYVFMHLTFRGQSVPFGRVMPLAVGVVLIVAGNQMGKIRPNWFVGLRTPWTLSSKRSWVLGNRLGGAALVVGGFALLVAAAIDRTWALVAAAVIMSAGILVAIVYSYIVWRSDPDKVPPVATLPADET